MSRSVVEISGIAAVVKVLGSVDILSYLYESTYKMQESEVSVRQLIKPGEDATVVLDLADETFDEMTLSV